MIEIHIRHGQASPQTGRLTDEGRKQAKIAGAYLKKEFPRLFEKPYKYFNNCQLIIYSDEDPQSGETQPKKLWVKSVCPWAPGQFGHDWLPVNYVLD